MTTKALVRYQKEGMSLLTKGSANVWYKYVKNNFKNLSKIKQVALALIMFNAKLNGSTQWNTAFYNHSKIYDGANNAQYYHYIIHKPKDSSKIIKKVLRPATLEKWANDIKKIDMRR